MDSVEGRMRSFVAWHGEVPADAARLEDFEARNHAAAWVRRVVGNGIARSYIIAFAAGDAWWTYLFEREAAQLPEGVEQWLIEGYNHSGQSSTARCFYCQKTKSWFRSLREWAVARSAGGARGGILVLVNPPSDGDLVAE
jgi:hypothetical protein